MNPIDINALIEKAKRNAGAAPAKTRQAISHEETKEASEVEGLMHRVDDALEIEEINEGLKKQAAQERRRNVTIAKLLTAADIFSGVSQ